MEPLIPLLVSGITLGMAYATIPGPVMTESMRRGLTSGVRPAWEVQIGSLVGDFVWALLGVTGAVVVLQRDSVAVILSLTGAELLFSLARSAFRTALTETDKPAETRIGHPLKVGVLFSLANPAGLAFWMGVGAVRHRKSARGLSYSATFGRSGYLAWE